MVHILRQLSLVENIGVKIIITHTHTHTHTHTQEGKEPEKTRYTYRYNQITVLTPETTMML